MTSTHTSNFIRVGELNLHYLEAGKGPPVLLLHGWPTSSFLWRHTLDAIAQHNRVIALDLPGFGRSDKPLSASYSFRFYERVLEGFLDALGCENVGLAVHDLGGPVGLYWALRHQERVRRLALLNTLVYPRVSWAVAAFVASSYLPGLRSLLVSPRGLRWAMQIGVHDRSQLSQETFEGVCAPFASRDARKVLLKTAHSLHPGGMREIAERLPSYAGPVRIIYGAKDRILPDVADTMKKVARDLPQATTTRLADCGHFLQEERGQEIGEYLRDFFAEI
ncbi:MAG: alpha/beta fold hydrolase [Nannocystaceae bacterium]